MDESLVKYFMSQTNDRLDKIDKKLEELMSFRWRIVGATTLVSSITAITTAIIVEVIARHY